ncbi:uncharacterized protein LOC113467711 [Diaphorina citri]|uniref:Uncharacterized protein LOC113467711 n=1 Tax=Diaphorina citri TaxID=121845 RepID=A0A3Q0IUB2_DIACI|nr:uncharacterized protein LOC113467711 [Diaphorina citri]KAI5705056.1 hypothetical protein M8J75_011456 [Diaphorina citri]KAI5737555.1 hypothetical protein M8J76_014646 [Diaphorina citri]
MSFFKKTHVLTLGQKVTHYFRCHRSGKFVSQGSGIRHLKASGSCKINGICPAKMKVVVIKNEVITTFYPNHEGHGKDVQHLRLTKEEKMTLAKDLADGIPFNRILDKVRSTLESIDCDRIHLLITKDLQNIVQQFNLEEHVRHSDDSTSVESWIEEMKTKDDQCVVYYKTQGKIDVNNPALGKEDFVLIIMNNAQTKILQQYGQDCICLDSTHGTNQYDFQLTTVLVLDEHRQGFPCAFIVSNKIDTPTLSTCFTQIRNRSGLIHCNVFMSDMAPALYNSWVHAMDKPEKRLFCAWHVDKAWRTNVKKVVGAEKQVEVYKKMKCITMLLNQDEFRVLYEAFINELMEDRDCREFAEYLKQYYCDNVESWAYCFRLYSGLNTNMHLESMHRRLKYIYLHGKNGKRLDKTIGALMTFIRDKLHERIISLTRGSVSSKLQDIRSSHKKCLTEKTDIVRVSDNKWEVQSNNRTYFVMENNLPVKCACKLACTYCNACIHEYFCSCHNSVIQWNMCKHIHSVLQKFPRDTEREVRIVDFKNDSIVASISTCPANISSPTNNDLGKEACRRELLALLDSAATAEDMAIIKKGIGQIKATLTAVRSQNKLPAAKSNGKRNISPQRRLHSTKKQRPNKRKELKKPSVAESDNISTNLILSLL